MKARRLLSAAGIAVSFATLFTFMVFTKATSSSLGAPSNSGFGYLIGWFSLLGFVTGVPASVLLLRGRYHDMVPLGVTLILLAAFLTLFSDATSWGGYALLIVPLCILGLGLTTLSKTRKSGAGVSGLKSQAQSQSPSNYKVEWITVATIFTIASIFFVGGYLGQISPGAYTRIEQITITRVTFGSAMGQVTFALANSGTSDVTIAQVLLGPYPFNASVSTNTIVPRAGNNISLTVIFTSFTFQAGTTYNFTLVSNQGSKFPYAVVR